MPQPLRRLQIGLAVLGAVFLFAVLGYRLAGWDWLDAIYMVVTTLTTVGYREVREMTPALMWFNIVVILVGVATTLYVLGGFVHMVLEGEINRALGHRRVVKEIERLEGHAVICGFGRMGEVVAAELRRRHQPLVVVDRCAERVDEAIGQGFLAMPADATEEEALRSAGIPRAKTLVVTLPSDADNVFLTLTARDLNPRLLIIARAELRTTEKKLLQAGADRVVLPATTAALRMAAMVTRPSTVELIDLASAGHLEEMAIDELPIPPGSPLIGVTIRDSHARSQFGLLIVALRSADGQLSLNPGASAQFQQGDAVIALGRVEDIERFRAQYRV